MTAGRHADLGRESETRIPGPTPVDPDLVGLGWTQEVMLVTVQVAVDNCQVQELLATHVQQVTLVSELGGPVLSEGGGEEVHPLRSSTLARQELRETTLLALRCQHCLPGGHVSVPSPCTESAFRLWPRAPEAEHRHF